MTFFGGRGERPASGRSTPSDWAGVADTLDAVATYWECGAIDLEALDRLLTAVQAL